MSIATQTFQGITFTTARPTITFNNAPIADSSTTNLNQFNNIGAIAVSIAGGNSYVLAVTSSDYASSSNLTVTVQDDAVAEVWWTALPSVTGATANVTFFVLDKPPSSKQVVTALNGAYTFSADLTSVSFTLPKSVTTPWSDFTRIQAVLVPVYATTTIPATTAASGSANNQLSAIQVFTSDGSKFSATFSAGNMPMTAAMLPNTQSVAVVYDNNSTYTIAVSNAFETLYQTLQDAAVQYASANQITTSDDAGITTSAAAIANQILASNVTGVAFQPGSDAYAKAADVLTFVVKQILNDVCAAGNKANCVTPFTANPLAAPTSTDCSQGPGAQVMCTPYMANVYRMNAMLRENVSTLGEQINTALGASASSGNVAARMITATQTYGLQNKNSAAIIQNVVNDCKTTYMRVILFCGAALFVCVMNIVTAFFMAPRSGFQRFLAFLFMFLYVASFAAVVVFCTTTKS